MSERRMLVLVVRPRRRISIEWDAPPTIDRMGTAILWAMAVVIFAVPLVLFLTGRLP